MAGRYCAQYTDAAGKARYLYRKTKSEARQALRDALRDRDEGIVPPSKMTVGVLLDEWLESISDTVSDRTWINQELIVRRHLKPAIGSQELRKLSGRDVHQLYRSKLPEGFTRGTAAVETGMCALHAQESPFRLITSTSAVGNQC